MQKKFRKNLENEKLCVTLQPQTGKDVRLPAAEKIENTPL